MQEAVHAYTSGAVQSQFMASSSPGASLCFVPFLGEEHERAECTREEEDAVDLALPRVERLGEALSSGT